MRNEAKILPALRNIIIEQADRDGAVDWYGQLGHADFDEDFSRKARSGECDGDDRVLARARGRIFNAHFASMK